MILKEHRIAKLPMTYVPTTYVHVTNRSGHIWAGRIYIIYKSVVSVLEGYS